MSSFRKRVPAAQAKLPPATRLNPQSAQLLVSTGVPSLDDVLGGGLPVGGVLLVEEDRGTEYSSTLLSYFSSQAIAAGHKLCVVNADKEVDLASQLPGWAGAAEQTQTAAADSNRSQKDPLQKGAAADDAMRIAWRYQNLPRVDADNDDSQGRAASNSALANERPYCERFDLLLRIPAATIASANVQVLDADRIQQLTAAEEPGCDMYQSVLKQISSLIDSGFSSLAPPVPNTERSVLRISIQSLGSGFWQGADSLAILQFLRRLRGLLRYSYAVCVVSLPVHLYEEGGSRLPIVRRIEHLCDAVIELESFEGAYASPADIAARQLSSEAGPTAQEYHGFLHIHKLPRLNSLTASMGRLSLLHTGGGSANNLAFRLRRKKFSIETYHLPIEGGVSERRVSAVDEAGPRHAAPGVGGVGCGSTPGRKDPLAF
ncbi:Elongator subunit elp4 [Coemansia sp. RSA 552]|nr:Elongator subunit elp4 [Coemansia sp. RSA 552]